jgi:predicted RecB family nuclease
MTIPHLTKSRYLAGLQCPRRLWLLVNDPPPYGAPEPGSIVDMGSEIGVKARLLFPGGVLVAAEPWQHREAVAETGALMADPAVPAIFEAAFEYDDIRVRVDILIRHNDGTWGLVEVKSSTSLKDHYIDDIAIQVHVLQALGILVPSIELFHVNTGYVRGANRINWDQFFTRLDVSREVQEASENLAGNIQAMRASLDSPKLPFAKPGLQCSTPYDCEFWDRCTEDKPADWVTKLPRLSARQAEELEALGIESIAAIPPEFRLTAKQTIIRDATASGTPFVAPDLHRLLHRFGPPALYMDFEAMMPAIPLYEGTSPYQPLPFQWSLHQVTADGELLHSDYLAGGEGDPRREFSETLIAAASGTDLPIIVYSPYEQTTLKRLVAQFPDISSQLNELISRLADLLPVVRGAVYHPDFQFSNSIKNVAPALSPGFGYGDLDGIADGGTAAAVFAQLAAGFVTDPAEVAHLRRAFLAYCQRDTLAMVEVHRALLRFTTIELYLSRRKSRFSGATGMSTDCAAICLRYKNDGIFQ